MKKKILIKPIFLILLSCGFKPINQKNSATISIQNLEVIGEQRIAYILKNNILLISSKDAKNKYDATIKIQKEKNSKIKDKTGKTTRYSLYISADLELTSLNDGKKIQKIFSRTGEYQVASIHSDTIVNENVATKTIIQQVSDDILTFLTLAMRSL